MRVDGNRHECAARSLQLEPGLAWEAEEKRKGAVVGMGAGAGALVRVACGGGRVVQHAEDGAGGTTGLVVARGEVGWVGDVQGGGEEGEEAGAEGLAGGLEAGY